MDADTFQVHYLKGEIATSTVAPAGEIFNHTCPVAASQFVSLDTLEREEPVLEKANMNCKADVCQVNHVNVHELKKSMAQQEIRHNKHQQKFKS